MPTYEYLCEKCGHTFEVFQSMKADPLEVCPQDHCGKKRWGRGKIRRAIGGGAGLIFKGSGFYITDYRSDNYKAAAKQDGGSASTPATTPSAATTPKTATPSSGSSSPSS